MAAKEVRTFLLNLMDRDVVLEHLSAFGWELVEMKETKMINHDLPRQGGFKFYEEVKLPFVEMTLSRDYNLKNIYELKALEKEYNSIKWPKKPGIFGNKRDFERKFNQCVITVNELVERGRHYLHEDD